MGAGGRGGGGQSWIGSVVSPESNERAPTLDAHVVAGADAAAVVHVVVADAVAVYAAVVHAVVHAMHASHTSNTNTLANESNVTPRWNFGVRNALATAEDD